MSDSITSRGKEFPVRLNARHEFYTELNGVEVTAPSYAELKEKLDKQPRAKLDVGFTQLKVNEILTGTVTGVRMGRDEKLLVRWGDGRNSQEYRHSMSRVMRPLTRGETTELERLLADQLRAQRAVNEYITAHRMSMSQAVTDALAQAGEA